MGLHPEIINIRLPEEKEVVLYPNGPIRPNPNDLVLRENHWNQNTAVLDEIPTNGQELRDAFLNALEKDIIFFKGRSAVVTNILKRLYKRMRLSNRNSRVVRDEFLHELLSVQSILNRFKKNPSAATTPVFICEGVLADLIQFYKNQIQKNKSALQKKSTVMFSGRGITTRTGHPSQVAAGPQV